MKIRPRAFSDDFRTHYCFALTVTKQDFEIARELAPDDMDRYVDMKIEIDGEIFEMSGDKFMKVLKACNAKREDL